jgi:hypothetical protein
LKLAAFRVGANAVTSKSQFAVTTLVSGGPNGTNGWIAKEIVAPDTKSAQEITVRVIVKDADGHMVEESGKLTLKPSS